MMNIKEKQTQQVLLSFEEQLIGAKQFILNHNDFLVVSHMNPDGDAASSTMAMGWMLKQLNKRFTLINEDIIPNKFNYLWGNEDILSLETDSPSSTYCFIICVDCADFSRIGKVSSLFNENVQILNIDHHPTNDYFGDYNLICEYAAATTEILYDLANKLKIQWSKELGTCIYTGLLTDSGGFRYANTTPKVMNIASHMLDIGVDGHDLADRLLEKISVSHLFVLQKALLTLSFSHDQQICWISVTAEDISSANASKEDLEGIVNYPHNIEGVEVGILFKETEPQQFKISLRSSGKVNVAAIAQLFGGGGHVRAAGCSLTGSLDQVTEWIVKEVGFALG